MTSQPNCFVVIVTFLCFFLFLHPYRCLVSSSFLSSTSDSASPIASIDTSLRRFVADLFELELEATGLEEEEEEEEEEAEEEKEGGADLLAAFEVLIKEDEEFSSILTSTRSSNTSSCWSPSSLSTFR